MPTKVPYREELDASDQIDTEERIAAAILDHPDVEINDKVAADLGRDIFYLVLREFRPDLFEDYKGPSRGS